MRASSLVLVVAVALAALLVGGEAKHLDRCEIVSALKRHGITSDLRNWVCLVESESGGRTEKRGPRNKNGSYDYGLFQINSKYWCGIGKVAGDCHLKCEAKHLLVVRHLFEDAAQGQYSLGQKNILLCASLACCAERCQASVTHSWRNSASR